VDNFVRHLAAYLAERWDKMYPGWGNPIEIYLKAAEEGYAAAQLIVGLAHLEGDGIEKNGLPPIGLGWPRKLFPLYDNVVSSRTLGPK
jgi:TPR repeat protein